MSKVTRFPVNPQIEAEACGWIAQFDGRIPSPADLDAFREWINQSPQHREEIKRLAGLWSEMNVLTELALYTHRSGVVSRSRSPTPAAAVAIASVILIMAVAVLHFGRALRGPVAGVDYATAVGEQRSLSLADGSKVVLNTDSAIQVIYSSQGRTINLLRGEGYFKVAADARRPFVVNAGRNAVRALGTAFSIQLRKQDVEVTVTEGAVEVVATTQVSRSGTPRRPEEQRRLLEVRAGQAATVGQQVEALEIVKPQEIDHKLSWRAGILSFSGETLVQVIAEVSRYTPVEIVITDPSIRDMRVGGSLRIGEPDAMLEALETSFGVRVKRVNDRLVYLVAK
jgi:transmembrane sensor